MLEDLPRLDFGEPPRTGVEVKRRSLPGVQARWSWIDDDRRPGPRYYYLRARQSDGHLGWTSPVWLDP